MVHLYIQYFIFIILFLSLLHCCCCCCCHPFFNIVIVVSGRGEPDHLHLQHRPSQASILQDLWRTKLLQTQVQSWWLWYSTDTQCSVHFVSYWLTVLCSFCWLLTQCCVHFVSYRHNTQFILSVTDSQCCVHFVSYWHTVLCSFCQLTDTQCCVHFVSYWHTVLCSFC